MHAVACLRQLHLDFLKRNTVKKISAATVSCDRILVKGMCGSSSDTSYERVRPFMKKQISRCGTLVSFETPNKIQRVAGAAFGEIDGVPHRAARCADGYHRIPNVNANSDGDFDWNLGNFENDWNDNNCLLCFCYSFAFSHSIFEWEFCLRDSFSIRRAFVRLRQGAK